MAVGTPIQSGVLALSLNYGAYMAEIFRAQLDCADAEFGEARTASSPHVTLRYFDLDTQAVGDLVNLIEQDYLETGRVVVMSMDSGFSAAAVGDSTTVRAFLVDHLLADRVAALEEEMADLRRQFEEFRRQFQ